jgi:hypothetical protein
MLSSESSVPESSQRNELRCSIFAWLGLRKVANALDRLNWASCCEGLELSQDILHEPDLLEFLRGRFRSPDFEEMYSITRAVFVRETDEYDTVEAFLKFHKKESRPNPAIRSSVKRGEARFSEPDRNAAYEKFKSMCEETPSLPAGAHFTFVWLGVDNTGELVYDVCRDGPRNCRTTDGGNFGAGIYCSPEIEYAATYSDYGDSHELAVILFAVSISQVYPITTDDYRTPEEEARVDVKNHGFSNFFSRDATHAIALHTLCNAHFIPVKDCANVHPRNGNTLDYNVGFQATSSSDAKYHELVIASHHQFHPIAIVYGQRKPKRESEDE